MLFAAVSSPLSTLPPLTAPQQSIASTAKREGALKAFKEAHTYIKRVLIEIDASHEHQVNDDWHLSHARIRSMPSHLQRELLKNLRLLVVSFDGIPEPDRQTLTTAAEIIRNRAWLIKVHASVLLALISVHTCLRTLLLTYLTFSSA